MLVTLGRGNVRRQTALCLSLPTQLSFSLRFFRSLLVRLSEDARMLLFWIKKMKTWIAVEYPGWLGRRKYGTRLEQRKVELAVF